MLGQLRHTGSMSKIITVRIDPLVIGMIPRYLDNCRNHVRAMRGHIEQRNFTEIQLIAHGLKGSGGSFGLDEISRYGKSIEENARDRKLEMILKRLEQFEAYLNALRVEPDVR